MSIDHTLSPADLANRFGTDSDYWVRQGVRDGRFPCLRVGRRIRFTEDHVDQIAELLEHPAQPAPERPAPQPANTDVFGATRRSVSRHRKGGVA